MKSPVGAGALAVLALVLTPAAQAQTVTIQLTSLTTIVLPHDLAPKGKPNKGDSIDFKDLLTNRTAQFGKQKGKPVAYDVGRIVYTSPKDTRITVIATFPGLGTITYRGPFETRKDGNTVLQISGGTGAFKGATGTVTIGNGATTAPNTYVVHLRHPLDIHAAGRVA
jgi:hypothetical protein